VGERGLLGQSVSDPGGDRLIERAPTGITAFVGRTLRGPLDCPVRVASFADFERTFGGLWQPSTLSYAIEQFFDNGGRQAIVVRVANGARVPTLALPAGSGGELRLNGVNPGSREYLRAAVDYDGLAAETDRFNLVLQRVRAPRTEQIEDQEIYRRASIEPGSPRFVGDLLLGSRLMRLQGRAPAARPDPTAGGPGGACYVSCGLDADDGAPLSDYDVIGSAAKGTGLWALQSEEGFDLMCIPPLGRDADVGLATLHVAARFCRDRRAMLVVDPPSTWTTAERALRALRSWPFRSENAVMFYPRITAFDRLRRRPETFGSAAAAAGQLARQDGSVPVWAAAEAQEAVLRRGTEPAVPVEDALRSRLSQAGINTLLAARSSDGARLTPCTLAGGTAGCADWRHLAARRLANYVVSSIELGVRWLLHAANGPAAWSRAQREVERFLEGLHHEGAFAGSRSQDSYFVVCDERVNRRDTVAEGKIHVLFGIATARPAAFHAWLVTYQGAGSRVRPVAVNRLATSQERVDWEIETAILRG
jgi:Bacteriophage tail sheath protein